MNDENGIGDDAKRMIERMKDTRECQCEDLHVGPICKDFQDNDGGFCLVCEHDEACHEQR